MSQGVERTGSARAVTGSSGANGLNSIPEFSPTEMDIKFPVIYFVTLAAASGNPLASDP